MAEKRILPDNMYDFYKMDKYRTSRRIAYGDISARHKDFDIWLEEFDNLVPSDIEDVSPEFYLPRGKYLVPANLDIQDPGDNRDRRHSIVMGNQDGDWSREYEEYKNEHGYLETAKETLSFDDHQNKDTNWRYTNKIEPTNEMTYNRSPYSSNRDNLQINNRRQHSLTYYLAPDRPPPLKSPTRQTHDGGRRLYEETDRSKHFMEEERNFNVPKLYKEAEQEVRRKFQGHQTATIKAPVQRTPPTINSDNFRRKKTPTRKKITSPENGPFYYNVRYNERTPKHHEVWVLPPRGKVNRNMPPPRRFPPNNRQQRGWWQGPQQRFTTPQTNLWLERQGPGEARRGEMMPQYRGRIKLGAWHSPRIVDNMMETFLSVGGVVAASMAVATLGRRKKRSLEDKTTNMAVSRLEKYLEEFEEKFLSLNL